MLKMMQICEILLLKMIQICEILWLKIVQKCETVPDYLSRLCYMSRRGYLCRRPCKQARKGERLGPGKHSNWCIDKQYPQRATVYYVFSAKLWLNYRGILPQSQQDAPMFVRLIGLEPTRPESLDPKSSASTNFATGAEMRLQR